MILTNSLSDFSINLRSCFYMFHISNKVLILGFTYSTGNSIQYTFQQATAVLFFEL